MALYNELIEGLSELNDSGGVIKKRFYIVKDNNLYLLVDSLDNKAIFYNSNKEDFDKQVKLFLDGISYGFKLFRKDKMNLEISLINQTIK